jgi:hypothetical protein
MDATWHPIASDIVNDAKAAGFEVKCFDTSLTGQPLLDRAWYVWASMHPDTCPFLQWYESHQ